MDGAGDRRLSGRAVKQNSRFVDLPGEASAPRKKQRRSSKAAAAPVDKAAVREAATLVERLTDGVMELHFSGGASLRQVARKYAMNTKTLSKYHQAVQEVLRSATPKDRDKVMEAIATHNKSFRSNLGVHQRRFTPFQELLILGVLWLFEDVSIPMTKQQIMFIIRNTMHERQVKAFGLEVLEEPDNMDSWYTSFSRRHEEDLKLRRAFSKKDSVEVAGGVVSVRRWFEKLGRLEQKLMEDNLLPLTGLQPFQMINYSEMSIAPLGRLMGQQQQQQDQAPTAEPVHGSAPDEPQLKFPIQYGILTTGEGKVLSGHLFHQQPDTPISDALVERFAQPAITVAAPKAELDKPISEYEAISQRRKAQPHWLLSYSPNDNRPDEDIGQFVSQLIDAINAYRDEDPRCDNDTIFVLTLESHHAVMFDEVEAIKLLSACLDHKVFVLFIPIHLSLIVQPNNRGFYHYFNDIFAQVLQAGGTQTGAESSSSKKRKSNEENSGQRTLRSAFMTALAVASDSNQSKSLLRTGMMEAGLTPNHDTPGFLPMTRPAWYIGNPLQMLELESNESGNAAATSDAATSGAAASSSSASASSSSAAAATAAAAAAAASASASSGEAAAAPNVAGAQPLDPLQARVQAQIEAFRHAVKEAEEHLMRQRGRILTEAQQSLNKVQLEYRETLRNLSASSADQIPGGVERLFGALPTPADDKLDQDSKRRRLSRHKRHPLFDLFCSEQGYEVDEATEEELLQLSDDFVRLTKQQKQQLEQRLEQQNAAWRSSPDDERMARLCRRASFKAFVAEATQQLPTNLSRPQLEGFAVIFGRLNAATKARLMYRWRDNPLNVRPIQKRSRKSSVAGSSSPTSSFSNPGQIVEVTLPITALQEAGV